MKNISITQFLKGYYTREYTNGKLAEDFFFDWFCKDSELPRRAKNLTQDLLEIVTSPRFNPNTSYFFFKNNCPMEGELYDDFRICDMNTGKVLYTVVPSSGFKSDEGQAEVWGRENDFDEALVEGEWSEIVEWFQI
jgi:hypothetical protein